MSLTFSTSRASEEIPCPDEPPCNAVHRRVVGQTIYCINGRHMSRDRFCRIIGWFARRWGWETIQTALADGWPA